MGPHFLKLKNNEDIEKIIFQGWNIPSENLKNLIHFITQSSTDA